MALRAGERRNAGTCDSAASPTKPHSNAGGKYHLRDNMVRLTHLLIYMKKTHAGIGQILTGTAKIKHAQQEADAQAKREKKIARKTAARNAKILRRQLAKVPKDPPLCFNNMTTEICGVRPRNTYNLCDLCLRRGKG
jgi:hypothetical protein